jgi:anti-sigma factor RsiW
MNGNNVPVWKLERYLLGELPADELGAIAALERSDDDLRGRVAALRTSDAEILEKYPPAWMARKVKQASAAAAGSVRHSGRLGVPRWAIPVFACAALLLMLPIIPRDAMDNPENAVVYEDRVKGGVSGLAAAGPRLEIWRKAGDGAERLAPDETVQDGDIIQLRYTVPKSCYGALVSMDGRGVLTVHLSGDNGKAAQLTPGRPVALETAYQLDDAPKYEAFYLITAPKIFDLETVKMTLMNANHPIDDGQGLPLPQKQVTAFTLRKFSEKCIN